jgi:hypothetical protein
MMVKHLAAVLLIFIILFNIAVSDQVCAQSLTRDLTLYEKAGPYHIRPLARDVEAVKAEIREFLWQHWHEHRRGHLVVVSHSKEGEPSTASYFIEPYKNNNWNITVKIDRVRYGRRPTSDPAYTGEKIRETVEYAANFVERIEIPSNGLVRRVVIPKEEPRSPQLYRLRLKDKNKKVLVEL